MTIRIPIIGQSTTTSFVPQQDVQAIQIADPRGQALQGLGKGLEEFGDGLAKYNKAQALKQAAANDTTEPHPAIAFKADQDNNAWALQAYAQCVKHGSDLTAHLAGISTPGDGAYPAADSVIASTNAGADASPLAHPATLLSTPNPIQAMIAGLMPGGSAGVGNPGNPDPAANDPSPTDPGVHGTTGAWINGYDLGARAAIAAAPSKSVAASLAAQCGTDRLQGARAIMGLEAQGNVQQRQSTALSAAQTIATYGVAADPATLPQALAFFQRHPIRIEGSAAEQASFDATLRQTLVGAGIQTLLARDPRGTLRQLEGDAGGEGEQGKASANGEPSPAAALHPAIATLTPEERMAYIPQARAAVYVAQGKAQADLAQRTTAAIAPGATAAPPPALPEFISAYGAERGTQLHSEMTDKLSQNQYRQNFAALPSAEVERARNDAQAGLHATARANADTLGTPAPADTGTDGKDSAFTLRTQADVADPHYAAQSREATNLQSAAAAILDARAQDPVKAGIDAGAFGLKPADMGTPQAVLASAATRAPVVGVIADTYNTGRVAFSNSEFADLGKTAAAMPPQERGPFFKQLADKLGDPELVRATFKRLGADNPVLAEAARMQVEEQASQPGPAAGATGIISAPEHMYKGYTLLNPTDGSPPQPMPPDAQTRAAFTPGETDAQDPGAAETRYQAARAIYASLAKDDGDKGGEFDPARWNAAQNLATWGSGTAREVGLGLRTETADAHMQRMRYTFADASGSTSSISDVTGTPASETNTRTDGTPANRKQLAAGRFSIGYSNQSNIENSFSNRSDGGATIFTPTTSAHTPKTISNDIASGLSNLLDFSKMNDPNRPYKQGFFGKGVTEDWARQKELTDSVLQELPILQREARQQHLLDTMAIDPDEREVALQLVEALKDDSEDRKRGDPSFNGHELMRRMESMSDKARIYFAASLSPEDTARLGMYVREAQEPKPFSDEDFVGFMKQTVEPVLMAGGASKLGMRQTDPKLFESKPQSRPEIGMDLNDRLKEIGKSKLTDGQKKELSKQFKAAAEVKPAHDALAAEVAESVDAKPKFAILKEVERSAEKLASKDSAYIVKDLTRSTLVVKDYAHAQEALGKLIKLAKEKFGENSVGEIKDTIDHHAKALEPGGTGYRDINVTIKINGQPTEFQINTPEMLRAKALETPLYEKIRNIKDRAAAEGRTKEHLTVEENRRIDDLTERSKKIYERAIEKIEARTGSQPLK